MKIGITGIANGGKTVFLTSLLWQLEELNSSKFSLSATLGLKGFKTYNKGLEKDSIFPLETYKDSLSKGTKWPRKTKASYQYHCKFQRKDWKGLSFGNLKRLKRLQVSQSQEVNFFDFPGERIADAAIAAIPSYEDWSDHILHHFQSHSDYSSTLLPYLELQKGLAKTQKAPQKAKFFQAEQFIKNTFKKGSLEKSADQETLESEKIELYDTLIHSYKLVLAHLIHEFKPLVSPSTFLLDEKGQAAPMVSVEELAHTQIAGLTKEKQFAPLTKAMREAFPEITNNMERYYKEYRKKVAWPLFQKIIQSQRLVILIDIPSLLMGGVGRYNDNRQILLDLFNAIEPRSPLGSLLQKLQAFLGLGLEKIAFVAVKADLVHPQDIASGRLESLLRQMTNRAKNILPDVDFGFFVCSAIHSTRAGKENHHLIGKPIRNNPEDKEMEFKISPLPEMWPDSWKAGEYRFIDVKPNVSQNLSNPPNQIGLDRVFEFLLTERGTI